MTHDDDEDEAWLELFDPDSFVCFERHDNFEPTPKPFTSTTYTLDLSPSSNLTWQKECILKLVEQGYKIVFDLDFGLFRPDFKGFLHQSYFQSCRFAMDHFISELLPEVQEHTLGAIVAKIHHPLLSLWRDQYEQNMPTDSTKEHFLFQMLLEYIDALTTGMPTNLGRIVLMQALQEPLNCFQWLSSDHLHRFTLGVKASPYCTSAICWEEGPRRSGFIGRTIVPNTNAPKIALLVPAAVLTQDELQKAFSAVVARNVPYKVIAEEELTQAWDGIDELILPRWEISTTCRRALDGFIAAGGSITQLT